MDVSSERLLSRVHSWLELELLFRAYFAGDEFKPAIEVIVAWSTRQQIDHVSEACTGRVAYLI